MRYVKIGAYVVTMSLLLSGLAIIGTGSQDENAEYLIIDPPTVEMGGRETAILDDNGVQARDVPPIQTITKTLEIPAGKQYYMWFDEATGTLMEMQMPDYTAGLTTSALNALAITPDWLDEDLAKKFGWMADINIDAGDRSTPTFADVDGDGDLDLVTGSTTGTLAYYENVDNALHYYEGVDVSVGAVYVQDTTTFTGVSVAANSDPAFADLDGDGDQDLTLGAADGNLYYYRNDAGSWIFQAAMYSGVGVSGYSAPAFADMDGDNDFDLTIGSVDGTFIYYQNDGTVLVPSWNQVAGYYGALDAGDYSNPAMADMDDDGDVDLTSGEMTGTVKYYRNNGGSWTELAPYSGIDVGDYSAPALVDLDFNRCIDLVVGANNGLHYYYENTGTAASFNKLIWTNSPTTFSYSNLNNYYSTTVTLKHRGDTSYVDTYAGLITSADPLWVDEVAFTIAHTSTSVLKNDDGDGEDVYPQIFLENAQYVYDADTYLDYVELVEKTGPDGDYTTAKYWVNDTVQGMIEYEVDREVYYWYVVHPKIEDELPTYVDPNEPNGFLSRSEPPPVGKFWRPWLFHQADGGYPILRDTLAGIDTLWNCKIANRVDNGAIGVVSQWALDSMTFTSDAERPHEPVRIYRKHIGRCGEWADLTSAAARSALIPCFNQGSRGSDHTWNEFYDRGWHVWEPASNVIANAGVYLAWGKSFAQINGPRPDSLLINRTAYYHEDNTSKYGHLIIWVQDASGNPVDGAKVSIGSWLGGVGCIGESWNYTDEEGKCILVIGKVGVTEHQGVEIHVSSKYGGGTMNDGQAARYIITGGEVEEHTMTLAGTVPRPAPQATQIPPDPPGVYRMVGTFNVVEGVQYPPQALTEDDNMINYHEHTKPFDNTVDAFICTPAQLDDFLKGNSFNCYDWTPNAASGTLDFEIPFTGDYYFVISNQDSIETAKRVDVTFELFPPPEIDITQPDGGELWMGGAGTSSRIWWNMTDDLDVTSDLVVDLYYSTDSGATYPNVIATGMTGYVSNPCYYDWAPVPGIDSTNVRVMAIVSDTLGKIGVDESLADFEIDSTAPAPATNVRAELTAPNHVSIQWDYSVSTDVDRYEVYYMANTWDATGDTYNFLADTGLGNAYLHTNVGIANPSSYFYQVRTYDIVGFETRTIIQAAKYGSTQSTFTNPTGWFLMGSSLVQSDTSLDHVIQGQGFPANWDYAQAYDAWDADQWTSYLKGRPDSKNDLTDITNTQGFWLHLTGNARFATAGYLTDMALPLKTGWNLVPYPFAQRSMTTANIQAHLTANCPGYQGMAIADYTQPYAIKTPSGSEIIFHNYGFWVKVSADTTWTVTNYY